MGLEGAEVEFGVGVFYAEEEGDVCEALGTGSGARSGKRV